jgi:hypothetical protein
MNNQRLHFDRDEERNNTIEHKIARESVDEPLLIIHTVCILTISEMK